MDADAGGNRHPLRQSVPLPWRRRAVLNIERLAGHNKALASLLRRFGCEAPPLTKEEQRARRQTVYLDEINEDLNGRWTLENDACRKNAGANCKTVAKLESIIEKMGCHKESGDDSTPLAGPHRQGPQQWPLQRMANRSTQIIIPRLFLPQISQWACPQAVNRKPAPT